jgi:puromycin-sensitive aminopeptidase
MIIFFNNFRAADLHEEKERLARSMGVCRNKDVIEKVLEFAMSDEIRSDP